LLHLEECLKTASVNICILYLFTLPLKCIRFIMSFIISAKCLILNVWRSTTFWTMYFKHICLTTCTNYSNLKVISVLLTLWLSQDILRFDGVHKPNLQTAVSCRAWIFSYYSFAISMTFLFFYVSDLCNSLTYMYIQYDIKLTNKHLLFCL
jgi:hypothetical protein